MTPAFEELAPFALLGILGAAHCAGMCGGFAIAVSASTGAQASDTGHRFGGPFFARQLAYVSGKALTYAVLGLCLSVGGRAIAVASAHSSAEQTVGLEPHALLSWLRGASAWLAGLAMIWFGLRMLGVPVRVPFRSTATAAHFPRLTAIVRGARSLPGSTGALATGLATGFLPCGLSWSAFALAAGHEPLVAFFGLLVFGLATAPALVLSAWGWSGLSATRRVLAARLAGPLLVLFGLFTIARGLPAGSAEVLPDCCNATEVQAP